MAPSVNLIPESRLVAQKRRRRIQAWIATVAVTIGVVGAGGAWSLLSIVDHGTKERMELSDLSGRTSQLQQVLDEKQRALVNANARLRAMLVVTLEPDWSLLMAVLAEALEDDAVLESFRLVPVIEEDAPADARPTYVVMLSGIARTQEGVSSYVLSLEGLALFELVTLKESARRTVNEQEVVIFTLQCEFDAIERGDS